jgi:ABC-type glycerol-3-phosphate transport system permease component
MRDTDYRLRRGVNTALIEVVLAVSALVIVFPFFWMIVTSLKTNAEILKIPVTFLPQKLFSENYRKLLTDPHFLRFYWNSTVVAVVGTVISTFGSLVAGFVFAKFRFPGKNLWFFLILATLMVPFQCYMIPLYIMAVQFRLIDTYTGLIFPIVVSSFGIFFVRQNMQQIPDSLLEAARIDGASIWRTFFRIVLPLSMSSAVVLAIFQFMTAWGDFIWPLVVTNSQKMFVLELGLARFRGEFVDDYGLMMTGATLGIAPVVAIFLVFRRYIIEGMTLSGMKA